MRHLARELIPVDKTRVIVNLVCPGMCDTALSRGAPPEIAPIIEERIKAFGRTPDHGSRTLLHGAVAGVESHGTLLHSCRDGE